MKDFDKLIRKDASTVLLMIVLFIVYYFILIAIGIALFGGAIWVTCQIPEILLRALGSFGFYGVGVAFLAFAAMWWFCIQIGWFLIKPLFLVQKFSREGLLEIKANDCQELFDMIKDVAGATNNRMPKHVFLSSEVNAYVFYNSTSLWSIFFPTKKNLTIGIGLLRGLSKAEVKAIICHEFGHFSQKTMRVGTVTYRLLLTVRSMVKYAQECQESNQLAMASEDYKWYFHMESWPISLITRSVIAFYNWIDKKDKRLSRNMEFEADAVACSIVGHDAMISSLCKLDTISERYSLYEKAIFNLIQNGSCPSDFWKGYLFFDKLISENDAFFIDYSDVFTSAAIAEKLPPSQLQFSNEYSSHPTLEERIKNAKEQQDTVTNTSEEDASLMISQNSLNEVGVVRMKFLVKQLVEQNSECTISWDNLKMIEMEQLEGWLSTFCKDNCPPRYIAPFINREVVSFDLPQIDEKEEVSTPFTDENRRMLLYYHQGVTDWNTLVEMHNNGSKVNFVYNNQTYNDAESALKAHKEYLDSFSPRIEALDINIYKYLWRNTNNKNGIDVLYWMVVYSADRMRKLIDLKQYINQIDAQITYYRQNGGSLSVKDEVIRQIDIDFKQFLGHLNYDAIDSLVGHWLGSENMSVHNQLQELQQYLDGEKRFSNSLPKVWWVNRLVNNIWNILERIHDYSRYEWQQRVIAAYKGEEYVATPKEKSISKEFQCQKVEDVIKEGEKEENIVDEKEEVETEENQTNCRCLMCKYYTEKILSTDSQFLEGPIPALAPGMGVQSTIDWCSMDDTPIESDMKDCPSFCKR